MDVINHRLVTFGNKVNTMKSLLTMTKTILGDIVSQRSTFSKRERGKQGKNTLEDTCSFKSRISSYLVRKKTLWLTVYQNYNETVRSQEFGHSFRAVEVLKKRCYG